MLAVRCAYNPKMHHHTHAKTKQARLGTSSRTSSSKKQHAVVVCNWCTLHICRTTQEAGVTFEKETEHDWKPRSPTRIKTGSKKNIHSWTLESFDLRMQKEKKDGKEFRGWISWMSVKGRCHSVEFNMPSSDGCTKTGEIVIDLLGFRHPGTGQKAWKRFTKPKTGTCIPQSRSLPQSPFNFQWIDWSTPVPGWSERLRNSCSDHSCKAPQETVGTRRKRLEDEAKALL